MPADFLSRSGLELEIHAINLTPTSMADYQNQDPEIRAHIEFRATGCWPDYLSRHVRLSMQQKESCFTTDIHQRFWVRTNARKQIRNLLYAPRCLRSNILQEAPLREHKKESPLPGGGLLSNSMSPSISSAAPVVKEPARVIRSRLPWPPCQFPQSLINVSMLISTVHSNHRATTNMCFA